MGRSWLGVFLVVSVVASFSAIGWGYTTSFSAAEGYSSGPLDGQDGWATLPSESENFTVLHEGEDSQLQVSGSQAQGFPMATRTYSPPADGSATLTSITLSFSPDGQEYGFFWGAEPDPGAPYSAPVSLRIIAGDPSGEVYLNGEVPYLGIVPDTTYTFDVLLDFAARIASVSLDGTPILSTSPFWGEGSDPGFFYIVAPGGGFTLYVDSISIGGSAAIPEPTSLALILAAGSTVALRRRHLREAGS